MTFGTLGEGFIRKLCISCTPRIQFLEFATDQFLRVGVMQPSGFLNFWPLQPQFLIDQFLIKRITCRVLNVSVYQKLYENTNVLCKSKSQYLVNSHVVTFISSIRNWSIRNWGYRGQNFKETGGLHHSNPNKLNTCKFKKLDSWST